jgi:exosome complex component RRP45
MKIIPIIYIIRSIRCDIYIIDNGGNLIDCASIATISALLHFRRPFTTVIGNQVTIYSPNDREPVPLSIHHIPICITFGFFYEGELMVVDPNLKEEMVMDGRMTICINNHREICAVQKGGGVPIPIEQVIQCSRIAAVKVEEIHELLNNILKNNQKIQKQKTMDSMFSIEKQNKSNNLIF